MTRLADMPQATQAGILCNDPQFQKFAASKSGFPGGQFTAQAAAEYLRTTCQIDSRRALNTHPAAQTKFAALRTDFDAWTGKIANQR